jgi:hypothetical protein
MDLINECSYCEAGMLRGVLDDTRCFATVAAKMSLARGSLLPEPAPLAPMLDGANAEGESDLVPLKRRADLFVKGSLRLARAAGRADLTLERNGATVGTMAVFGERVWSAGRPTEPARFEEARLSWRGAFGGIATLHASGMPIPYPENMMGRGYVLDEEQAEGVALPTFEDPEHLIQSPLDAPAPQCMAPRPFYDASSEPGQEAALSHHVASPAFRVDALDPGDRVTLRSTVATAFGEWALTVPALGMIAEVWLIGEKTRRVELPMRLDALGFELDRGHALLTMRATFTYSIVPGERRMVRLRPLHA